MDPLMVTTEAEAFIPSKRSKTTSCLPLPRHQFYHSQSDQPMTLDEVLSDQDSKNEVEAKVEAEVEAEAKRINDSMEENEIMNIFIQLWNYFVKKNRVLADAHIPWACEEFSKLYKKELHNNLKLDMCWRRFMMKQWDYGILDATTITKCNTIIQKYPATSDMDVEKNDHKSNKNEDNRKTTHASGSESSMCRNEEKYEMDMDVKALNTESSQVVDRATTLFQRSLGKRPVKQTPKMKEMIDTKRYTFITRGSSSRRGRGGGGRGGRGCGGSSGRENLI
ncbi:PREDICTED: polycomb group protein VERNALIZATION 2-like [Camelina sativa]|uniref:Polycomb group protein VERNALIZATION 2-like n=1 Tax=Camelina sativa TaxID=90675 RepID=A0ABM0WBJ0_CAMSA|nr:PREDICTED: polycomb group protein VERNALIZATION 2-like [Camelina sativa]